MPGRAGGPPGKRKQTIVRRGAAATLQPRAALGELVIERQAGHVRAATASRTMLGAAAAGAGFGGGKAWPKRAEREILRRGAARPRARRAPRRCHAGAASVTPNASPSGCNPGRQRDRREIEQIHEVRVVAEIGIQR